MRVAELLRGTHSPIDRVEHRHSAQALRLRTDVLDAELRFSAAMQYMQAWSALHGNPRADLEAAAETLKGVYQDALNEIPYMTGGRSGEEMMSADREAAVKRYREYRAKILKDPDTLLKVTPKVKPIALKSKRTKQE